MLSFNKNKILGQGLGFHEIDTSIEPFKGFDDILRQIRWEKSSTADVLQKKYDEFLANLRASFPLIQNGDDCFWAVLVIRGYASDLAKELRNTAQIARDELAAENSTETGEKKKQPWLNDAPDYMLLSEAIVKFAGSKPAVSTLSKKITPDGPIRYMRRGRRCKVHIGDFRKYAQKHYPQYALESEIVDEYLADVEARKAEEKKRSIKNSR